MLMSARFVLKLQIQKSLQFHQQALLGLSCPAFPDHKDIPAVSLQCFFLPAITLLILQAFLSPEVGVCGRLDSTVATVVTVPEAAVDEDHFASSGQDDVRFSGQ